MSVLIKGMEMPTSCYLCPVNKDDGFGFFTCGVTKSECDFRNLPSDCPLVPVPPHGRLIDADAPMLKILDYIEEYSDVDEKGWHNLKWCAMKEAEMAINNAPTIIEAEEGE